MTIDPALNEAILTGINTLQTGTIIPDTISVKALAGALHAVNAVCQAHTLGAIECELEHILRPGPIAVADAPAGFTDWGYVQADLEALS